MTEVWNSLHLDFEEKEVPVTLKTEVMDFVFENDKKSVMKIIRSKLKEWSNFLQKQFTPITAGILLGIMGLAIIINIQWQKELGDGEKINSVPVEVLSTLSLQGTEQKNRDTNGDAFILQQGETKRLVVQVSNLPRLEGSEVYQVWLLKNGERENAGIFKPGKNGEGMLIYQLAQNLNFDQIGITLEPDQYSSQPRGKKIMGSSL
ncbi:anti-sigma factor [Domibacillus aminovorans]|uniref:anti-sigma factor n=1 Tax=Domibacillus aminovorans TaxID=29332 RepID=UPI003D1CDCA9